MVNVINNAREAMEPRANDRSAQGQADTGMRLTVATRVLDARLEILVRDTGPGIPEDDRPHVLKALYSTKSFGVGLGLPTAREIMEQHGGGVEIDSREGEGTTVTLWLPLGAQPDGDDAGSGEA